MNSKSVIVLFIAVFFLFTFTTQLQATETGESESLDTLLMMDLEELIEVQFSIATRSLLSVRKAPAIATVITADQIKTSGARNLLDVLARVPGVGVSRTFFSVYEIEIRGIKSTRNEKIKFMVDGHSMNQPLWGGSSWAYENISLEQVERVEIIRGPGSALYGTSAFSGIINVVTKQGEDIDGTIVSSGVGSFDTYRTSIIHGKQYRDIDVLASLTYYNTNGAKQYVGSDLIGQSGYTDDWAKSWDAGLKLSWNDFTFNSKFLSRRNGPYVGVTNVLNDESKLETDQYFLDLSFNRSLSKDWNINARSYYDHFNLTFAWELFPEGHSFEPIPALTYPEGMLGTPHVKNDTYGFELGADYQVTAQNKITFGGGYEKDKQYDVTHFANFDPNTLVNIGSYQDISSWANWSQPAQREILSVYIQDEWEFMKDMVLTIGNRYDHFSDFGGTNNPRLGIVWNPSPRLDVKLLYGQAFRAPSFDEQYSDNNPAAIGNPDLDPEVIKTYEMAVGYRPVNCFDIRVSTFYNKYQDNISLVQTNTPGQYQFQNGGDLTVYGVETEARYRWSSVDAYVNHTWQKPEIVDTNSSLPNVPSYRYNVGLNATINDYFVGNVNALFVGERDRAVGDTRSEDESYAKVDLSLIAKEFFKGLEIRGSVHNIFDENYSYPASANTLTDDYPAEGRSFYLEARYFF